VAYDLIKQDGKDFMWVCYLAPLLAECINATAISLQLQGLHGCSCGGAAGVLPAVIFNFLLLLTATYPCTQL
jgi:hypothetical protein